MTNAEDPRRSLPGVDQLLETPWCTELVSRHGHEWIVRQARDLLDRLRSGRLPIPNEVTAYEALLTDQVTHALRPSLRHVINATGVVLHTNLGRAPLADVARDAMHAAGGYGNVEFDLDTGKRGTRYSHCVSLLRELTGADDGVVVNNCAAATALAITAFAGGRAVAVSHGELVEIGGGFRIPEVVESAGAHLRAVGTTNRTRLADYRAAVADGSVGAILKVHRSNFEVRGFTEEVSVGELVALADEAGIPVIYDLGSGLMVPSDMLHLPAEPTPAESVAAGAHLVAFSGDKLLGGPQSGLLVGSGAAIARARRHPLCRAVRTDKVTLAGLEATLALYRDPSRALEEIPTLRMLSADPAGLRQRAEALADALDDALDPTVVDTASLVGGGTYPNVTIPSSGVSVRSEGSVDDGLKVLRELDPPLIARARDDVIVLDLRTVPPSQDDVVAQALNLLVSGAPAR